MNAFELSMLRHIMREAQEVGITLRERAKKYGVPAMLLVDILRAMEDVEHCNQVLARHCAIRKTKFVRFSVEQF